MRIHITDIHIGDRLTSNVFNNFGLHVLSSNTVLTIDDIQMLRRHQIEYVDIAMRENFEGFIQRNPQLELIAQEVQPKYDSAVTGMKNLFEQVMNEGQIDERVVDENYEPLVEHFLQERDVVSLLLSLNSQDEYTYHHSVQVSMISYYIARWIGLSDEQSLLVGKAGYLHDIGKGQINLDILNKPSKLTDEEFQIMKQHTTLGHNIITRSIIGGKEIGLVALQHHERLNGSGYPNGISGNQLHPMSKIVAVADVYSAMISSRVYQKKKDLLYVLRELHKLSFSELDPQIVHTFIQKMVPNFIGKKLVLISGEIGHIVMTNPADPFRPLVRFDDQFVDLSKDYHLQIDAIYV